MLKSLQTYHGGIKMNCFMCSYYWMNDGMCWGLDRYEECPQFNEQYCEWCWGVNYMGCTI